MIRKYLLNINESATGLENKKFWELRALFTSTQKPKIFQGSSSYRIFRRMHRVLNIDENKNQLHNLVEIYETNLFSLFSL